MEDRLTFKLEIPEVSLPPLARPVPRCHFSHTVEDVVFEAETEPEPATPIADDEGVPV